MMPGMTGMELFEVLRREYPTLAGRVVFMTGGVSMTRVSAFLESVPNAKFEKPFDIAELRCSQSGILRQGSLDATPVSNGRARGCSGCADLCRGRPW